MQSEKRDTLGHYFLSANKKSHNNEQEIEPHIVVSLSLLTPETQDPCSSSSLLSDQTSTNYVLHNSMSSLILSSSNENFHIKSIPNDNRAYHEMMFPFKKN